MTRVRAVTGTKSAPDQHLVPRGGESAEPSDAAAGTVRGIAGFLVIFLPGRPTAVRSILPPLLALVLAVTAAVGQTVDDTPAAGTAEELRPGPPPPLSDLTDPNARAAESLNQPGIGSDIPKSLRGSASKAGGPANDLNTGGAPPEPPLPSSDLGAVVTGAELYHGNYCGTGNRGEGLPPTDALDAACMRHDACYDAAGYRSCACDAALRREATTVSERPDVSVQVRRRALSVTEAATVMGCRAP